MRIPLHVMNIYQKPKVGTTYIRQLQAYNYKHSINAIGGFDTASCDVALHSINDMKLFLDRYLGNRVSIIVDNPAAPIWEGFINRMSFSAGGVQYSIGLDQMANRVRAVYVATAGGVSITQGVSANSTASQAVYGIKEEQIDLGYMLAGTGATIIRDTVLAQRAYPKSSMIPSSGGSGMLHIEFLGFYHTLEWEDYRDATTGNIQLGSLVDTILGVLVNGTTFFDNADLTRTAANTQAVDRQTIKGETAWQVMQKAQEFGDTSAYWVLGVSPTDFLTGTRRFYYQQASTTIVYTARQADGLRIRNLSGSLIDPWRVQPDAGIRITDMLVGFSGAGDNPTETYILKIDYDANRQTCVYSGDDDLTAEGVFNLKRFNNAQGQRFGAARRLS